MFTLMFHSYPSQAQTRVRMTKTVYMYNNKTTKTTEFTLLCLQTAQLISHMFEILPHESHSWNKTIKCQQPVKIRMELVISPVEFIQSKLMFECSKN